MNAKAGILVVGDSLTEPEMVAGMLAEHGYCVSRADLEDAPRVSIERFRPSVLVIHEGSDSDPMCSRLNEWVLSAADEQCIPQLIVFDSSQLQDLAKHFQPSTTGLFLRPFHRDSFLERIRELLEDPGSRNDFPSAALVELFVTRDHDWPPGERRHRHSSEDKHQESEAVGKGQSMVREHSDPATLSLAASLRNLEKSLAGLVQLLAAAVEKIAAYPPGHQQRVAQLARAIALEMNLASEQVDEIYQAALIHDIGMINVPAEVLNKPSALTETEFDLVKSHPDVGFAILHETPFPFSIAQMVQQHHERLNRSGYPQHLSGDEIVTGAQVLAVADVVEAMVSSRQHRPAPGLQAALDEIERNRGCLYSAEAVDGCSRILRSSSFSFEWQ